MIGRNTRVGLGVAAGIGGAGVDALCAKNQGDFFATKKPTDCTLGTAFSKIKYKM